MNNPYANPSPRTLPDDSVSPLLPMEAGLTDLRRRMDNVDARAASPPSRVGRLLIEGAIIAVSLSVAVMIWWLAGR